VGKDIMKISLKILESNTEISNRILNAILPHFRSVFDKTQQSLQKIIPIKFKEVLMSEPEYSSLISGALKYELGIPDADSRIESIYDSWISSMNIEKKTISIRGNRLTGGFGISLIRSDFSDILSLPSATVVDSISGSIIPWLRWLLLEGGKILVRNYKVKYGPNPRSRTDNAIMIESSSQHWRVPAEFAGTIQNNWVTRCILKLDNIMYTILQEELEKNL
jgi:hypothetical protein